MIAKILKSSSAFNAVKYNTGKVDRNKGELLKVSGFGPLQGLSKVRPEDYINYLKMISAQNKRVTKPQFHAAISAKGNTATKEELLDIATKWLKEMGYADQPYLVIFHKDTGNNHVHVVSTRVGKNGKKINSDFERIRSLKAMNKIMGVDEKLLAEADLKKALSYHFSTKPQFKMILEQKGYVVREAQGKVELIKGGIVLSAVDAQQIESAKAGEEKNNPRQVQLKAIINKYRDRYSAELRRNTVPLASGVRQPVPGFTSDLAEVLKYKLGIELVFHAKADMQPYGYTVIDHSRKYVFKGSSILNLSELQEPRNHLKEEAGLIPPEQSAEVQISQAIEEIEIIGGQTREEVELPISAEPHAEEAAGFFRPENKEPVGEQNREYEQYEKPIDISISDDIDDEAILGRNRNRKKQARTNTR